jgi:hypothetical protein
VKGSRFARLAGFLTLVAAGVMLAAPGALAQGGDVEVTVGSNDFVFPQNKQNEPAVAINPIAPNILAAGANDEIDLEACNAGNPRTCPFTEGVGVSGIYFSLDAGHGWSQPTYTGWTARHCVGPPGFTCTPGVGPIGTLPRYYESGLASDGDPALAFGPKPGPNGFSWANGWRLYYANLTSNFSAERSEQTFKGFEAIAVSRLDDVNLSGALAGDNDAWYAPVLVSRQNAALFSDKEQIWVDNAETSPFFGNVYICNVAFRGAGQGNAVPEPVVFHRSTDGGETWQQRQVTEATNTNVTGGRQFCSVRTDSQGVVYLVWTGGIPPAPFSNVQLMARSFDGGRTFERPFPVGAVQPCGRFDPNTGRFSFDGIGGARTHSGPHMDIANGAPTGIGAPNTIVMTWCDGPTPTATSPGPNEQAVVQYSTDRGLSWTRIGNGAEPGDRPDFPALAISPDGNDLYLTYDAFLQPWQPSALAPPRLMQGVVRHADFAGAATTFMTVHRGAVGDARGSSQNGLTAEFLGDYNYAMATNDFGYAVWNDVREAADCTAIDAYRQAFFQFVTGGGGQPLDEGIGDEPDQGERGANGRGQGKAAPPGPAPQPPTPPAPNVDCPATFGNSDIWGINIADPTSP